MNESKHPSRRTVLQGAVASGLGFVGIAGFGQPVGAQGKPCFKEFECDDEATYAKIEFVIERDDDGNIVDCYFEEETDTGLVEVTSWENKEGEECEPVYVEWESELHEATKVKAFGGGDCETVEDPGGSYDADPERETEPDNDEDGGLDNSGGNVAAISNLQFCLVEEEAETEVMLATDVSESLDSDELPGAPSVDGESGDASGLEAVKGAIGDPDTNVTGFLSGLEETCPENVEIGAVSFSENLEHLDNDADGDQADDPAGNDADGTDAILDKALMDVGASNRSFNPNAGTDNGGVDEYHELKHLFGAGQDFLEEDEFVVDDASPGTPFGGTRYAQSIGGNDDYGLGDGDDTFVAERPYTGDGDSTQDDGLVKAIQALLPGGETFAWDNPDGADPDADIRGIDPSGNAAEPGEARKLVIYLTDGTFDAVGEDDPDSVDASEASANAESLGIEIKPILVNGNPSADDVDFAANLATSGENPLFVTHYDDPTAPCDDDVTGHPGGFTCTTMVGAMEDCLTDICQS